MYIFFLATHLFINNVKIVYFTSDDENITLLKYIINHLKYLFIIKKMFSTQNKIYIIIVYHLYKHTFVFCIHKAIEMVYIKSGSDKSAVNKVLRINCGLKKKYFVQNDSRIQL